jgi:uncharacterized protein YggE
MSDQEKTTSKNRRTLALIAGILAMGLVAASIAGGQMLNAKAQQQDVDTDDVEQECDLDSDFCMAPDSLHSVVTTSGTATIKVQPDKVTVTIGVETQGLTAQEAAAKNAELMDKVIAALKELGISDDQISTSWYSVFPVYEYKSPPCIEIYPQPPECAPRSEITGYRASNSLSVTLDASEDVGKVIDAAVAAGANNVSGAYFFVSDERQQEIRDGLIADAIANARSRADKAAGAVNMSITGVKSINLNDVYFPVFYKDVAQESTGVSTPILPGQQQVTMNVQVTFLMS